MPISKKKKGTNGLKSQKRNNPSSIRNFIYILSFLLVGFGQVLVFKGSPSMGMLLSALGLGLFGAVYLGVLKLEEVFSAIRLDLKASRNKGSAAGGKKSSPGKTGRGGDKFKGITPSDLVRAGLVLTAIFLGMKGQAALSDMGQAEGIGLSFYFAGVVLFLLALWPWKREELKLVPIEPKVEWTLFALIMVIAAFLRIYKLGTIPSGIFFDMGFQGYEALRILHEYLPKFFTEYLPHFWREQSPLPFDLVNIGPNYPSAPVPIYFGALWFIFFKNTQFNLNLFYVAFCLASFPLIYWTFRQLAGPRVALLTLYILAVMRWNLTFARNSFPPATVPFFMFGTLALLLYGLRTCKKWPFIVSGVLFGMGLYSYQSYKAFLPMVLLVALYECVTNRKAVMANLRMIFAFSAIFLLLASPMIWVTLKYGSSSARESELSIMSKVRKEHSLSPLLHNTAQTAMMFNRRGDPNPRHNLQDHRQLDDVTGMLLFFGLFYALSRFWRRKYFYALAGFFAMSLPCLLTIDPAHSSRMYGMTAFVAFLAASFLAAIWGRVRALGGSRAEIYFLILLSVPLLKMGQQNYKTYFVDQANNLSSWSEFSIAETTIGRKFAEYGDQYDCYVSPRFYGFYTINYLDYFFLDNVKRMDLPDSLAALPAPGRGLLYGIEQGRTGVLDTLKSYYPGGEAEILKDPSGNGYVYFYRVPPEVVDKARGLKAEFSDGKEIQVPRFPENLPPGPYRATFKGHLFLEQTGEYRFILPDAKITWTIGGKPVVAGVPLKLEKGFHAMEMRISVPEGPFKLPIFFDGPGGKNILMGPKNFMTVAAVKGLKAEYYNGLEAKGVPFLTQWDPVLNFVNGNDFPVQGGAMSIRWTGTLNIPSSGIYRFAARTSGRGGLKIDRQTVIPMGGVQGEADLKAGSHSVEVLYSKQMGYGADFNFLWVKPGDMAMEVVPNSAFGNVK